MKGFELSLKTPISGREAKFSGAHQNVLLYSCRRKCSYFQFYESFVLWWSGVKGCGYLLVTRYVEWLHMDSMPVLGYQ